MGVSYPTTQGDTDSHLVVHWEESLSPVTLLPSENVIRVRGVLGDLLLAYVIIAITATSMTITMKRRLWNKTTDSEEIFLFCFIVPSVWSYSMFFDPL